MYIHYGSDKFDKTKFKPITNLDWGIKCAGGLWASPIYAKYSWKDWCKDNSFRECLEENSFKFKLKDNVNVLIINSIDDINGLPTIDRCLVIGVCLDFEKLIKMGYDAIQVNISNDWNNLYWAFYSWDCDSLLVFNSNIIEEI